LLWVVALSPAFLQTTYSCERGDTYLTQLEFEAYGQNRIVGFDANDRDYALFNSSPSAIVRVVTRDAGSTATYDLRVGGSSIEVGHIGVGSGEVTIDIPEGQSQLKIAVRSPEGELGSALGHYTIDINPPCSAGECDDGSECTTDVCDTLTSTCEFTALADGTACDFTTVGDGVCNAGACESAFGTLEVNADFNLCAELTIPGVSPSQTPVGQSIALTAQAEDYEGDPITYLWTATGGSIDDPGAATTIYTCEVEGRHLIAVEISDDGFDACVEGWSTLVVCEEADLCAGVSCEDGDFCTDDSCDPATGGCDHAPTIAPPEPVEVSCADGLDNDCDGYVDSADPDCPEPVQCPCYTAEELAYNRPYDNCLDWDPTSQYGPGLYVNRDQTLIGGKTAAMKAFTHKPPYAPGLGCNFQGCGLDGWCNYTRSAYESNGDLTVEEWNVCLALLQTEIANANLSCQVCTSYGCN
jgi:hypothetical protein